MNISRPLDYFLSKANIAFNIDVMANTFDHWEFTATNLLPNTAKDFKRFAVFTTIYIARDQIRNSEIINLLLASVVYQLVFWAIALNI